MAKVKSTANNIQKRIDTSKLKSLGVLSYDFDNKYPQRTDDIVNDSGTATTALRIFRKFVSGAGAKDKDFGSRKVNNKGLTVDKLISKIADSLGRHGGLTLHFNYNGLGQKTEINFIPFGYNRLTLDEDKKNPHKIAVYDDWGQTKRDKLDKSKIEYLHKYNPFKVFEQVQSEEGETDEAKWSSYKGQIWYWTPEGDSVYPLAPFDSVLEDMITEAQTKRFKTNTAAKNFLASHIVVTGVEEAEEGEELPDGETRVGNALKGFTGGEGAGTMLHLERESEDEIIEIQKVEIQDYDGLYEFTENSARDSILRNFLIPPTLLIQTAGKLGTSSEIADAANYYNDITAPDRKIIEEVLEEAFNNFVYDMNPSGDYSIETLQYSKPIESEYFPYYTTNEIRIANGDAEAEDTGGDVKVLAVELGVGGTTALTALLANPDLTPEQKLGSMKVLFGLSEDQAKEMLGIQTNPNAQ